MENIIGAGNGSDFLFSTGYRIVQVGSFTIIFLVPFGQGLVCENFAMPGTPTRPNSLFVVLFIYLYLHVLCFLPPS